MEETWPVAAVAVELCGAGAHERPSVQILHAVCARFYWAGGKIEKVEWS